MPDCARIVSLFWLPPTHSGQIYPHNLKKSHGVVFHAPKITLRLCLNCAHGKVSKSRELKPHVGSIPTSGTSYFNNLEPSDNMSFGVMVRRI